MATVLLMTLTGCVSTPPAPQTVEIDKVLEQVKQALVNIQNEVAAPDLPPLKKVTLSLQTVATKELDATVKLWVITAGGTWEKDQAQEITITLEPPPEGGAKKVSALSLTEDLENAIISAVQGVKKAGVGQVHLGFSQLDVQIKFTVKATGKGGVNVLLSPVSPSATGTLSSTAVQTLTVSYGEAKPDGAARQP